MTESRGYELIRMVQTEEQTDRARFGNSVLS